MKIELMFDKYEHYQKEYKNLTHIDDVLLDYYKLSFEDIKYTVKSIIVLTSINYDSKNIEAKYINADTKQQFLLYIKLDIKMKKF